MTFDKYARFTMISIKPMVEEIEGAFIRSFSLEKRTLMWFSQKDKIGSYGSF